MAAIDKPALGSLNWGPAVHALIDDHNANPLTNGSTDLGHVDVRSYGAKGDTREVYDLATTNASATVTSATAAFVSADVGKTVIAPGVPAGTTITGFTSSTTVTLSASATATATGKYAAVGTDDSAPLQSAIAAVPEGATLYIPNALYLITAALVVNKNLSVAGGGVCANQYTYTESGTFDTPTKPPYLLGTVFLQATAATDAIRLTGSAKQVNLRNFGIRFADTIRFTNTGHGINATPTATFTTGGNTALDHGTFNSRWENLSVIGQDGNHYAFYLINFLNGTLDHLKAYGGGGFYVGNESYAGNYGNTVFNHPYSHLFVAGSAHNFCLRPRTDAATTSGVLNLMLFNRPQALQSTPNQGNAFYTGLTGPTTTAQKLFTAYDSVNGKSTNNYSVIAPDFESSGSTNGQVEYGNGNYFIDPSGLYGRNTAAAATMKSTLFAKTLWSDMTLRSGNGAPTVSAGTANGTSAPTPTVTGDDTRGIVTFGTGTGATGGQQVRVDFRAFTGSNAIVLTAANSTTAALLPYVSGRNSTGFAVSLANAPTSSQAASTYSVHYMVLP